MTTPPLPRAAQARVAAPFIAVTLIWGTTWYVIRGQLGVPVAWSICYRFAIGAAAMAIAAGIRRESLRLSSGGLRVAVTLGILQFVGNYGFVYEAERHVTSGLVAVVFALLIVPNAILGWLVLGEGLSRRFIAGSAIALAGIALLFLHEVRANPTGHASILAGVGFTLAAVLAAACGNVLQGTRAARAQNMAPLLAWAMAIGALADSGIALATSGPPRFEPSIAFVAGLLYLGVVASALAFFLYYPLIRTIGAARAAYSSVLIPILAMAVSTALEGYRWSLTAAAGAALVMAGLVVAIRARSPSR